MTASVVTFSFSFLPQYKNRRSAASFDSVITTVEGHTVGYDDALSLTQFINSEELLFD